MLFRSGGDILDSDGNSVLGGGGGGGNPFNQSLNTTDSVTFNKVSIPGTEDNATPSIDFFSNAPDNHVVTLHNDWTLKLKARAQGNNEGHLYLEAGGAGTGIKVNGNGSNVQITASDYTNANTWTFSSDGVLQLATHVVARDRKSTRLNSSH